MLSQFRRNPFSRGFSAAVTGGWTVVTSRRYSSRGCSFDAAGNSIFLGSAPDAPGALGAAGDDPESESFELCPKDMGGIGGSWAWSPALVDFDLDGRTDVYCCSGFVTGNTPADT